jgi:hypothetical protein
MSKKIQITVTDIIKRIEEYIYFIIYDFSKVVYLNG